MKNVTGWIKRVKITCRYTKRWNMKARSNDEGDGGWDFKKETLYYRKGRKWMWNIKLTTREINGRDSFIEKESSAAWIWKKS